MFRSALLLCLLAAAALLPAASSLAQGGEPPPNAAESLEELRQKIRDAEKGAKDGDKNAVLNGIRDAEGEKLAYIFRAFEFQRIHGCAAAELLAMLDNIDEELAAAEATKGKRRRDSLDEAKRLARVLVGNFGDCLPEEERSIANAMNLELRALLNQFAKDKLTDAKLRQGHQEVAGLKRGIVAGQEIYGCDVVEFFLLIERIDGALTSAKHLVEDKRKTRRFLERAEIATEELIVRWRRVPCEEGPPPPEQFEVSSALSWFHVNGFGTPPTRECNFISTSPPQAGATVTDVITPPAPRPMVTKTATTDGSGSSVISMNIDTAGTYTHETTVTSASGESRTVTMSQTVTSARTGPNGECPPPTP